MKIGVNRFLNKQIGYIFSVVSTLSQSADVVIGEDGC